MSQHRREHNSYATKGSLCPVSLHKARQVRLPFHSHTLSNETVMFCPCLLSTPLLLSESPPSTSFLTFSYAEAPPPYSLLFLRLCQFSVSSSPCLYPFFPLQIGVRLEANQPVPFSSKRDCRREVLHVCIHIYIYAVMHEMLRRVHSCACSAQSDSSEPSQGPAIPLV